jgi:nitroimidazol reductase NimA-like FMN-containing flavoprotein (pyridoxamine 5'-phosphate oxidase superfamily)
MNKQELARELGHPEARKLLSGSVARLAYNGHDGFPRVVPVGFYWTGERIVVSTAPTSPKAGALSSRPEVALTIDTGTTPEEAKALLVRGLATLETADGVTDEYLAAARRSMDEPELAEFERDVRSTYNRWCASRSSRNGRGFMTLALAGYPLSSRISSRMVSQTRVGVASWKRSTPRRYPRGDVGMSAAPD